MDTLNTKKRFLCPLKKLCTSPQQKCLATGLLRAFESADTDICKNITMYNNTVEFCLKQNSRRNERGLKKKNLVKITRVIENATTTTMCPHVINIWETKCDQK